jgi:hypothetical protein
MVKASSSRSLGFFSTLGLLAGTRQQENQLSRTFQACFSAILKSIRVAQF